MSWSRLDEMRQQAARDRVPLSVSLELTARCNFRCRHCYIPDPPPHDGLTTDRVLRLLDELAEAGTLFLVLTGGEPLLRPDLWIIVRSARALGFQVFLVTNGSLITPEAADAIYSLDIPVEISIPSMDPQTFDAFTRTSGSFQQTMNAVRLLHAREVQLRLKVPITTLNRWDFAEVFSFARQLGAPHRADPRILCRRDGDRGPLELRIDEREMLPHYLDDSSGMADQADAACSGDNDGPLCGAGASSAHLASTGELMACCALPGADQSILDQGFSQAWRSSRWLRSVGSTRLTHLAPAVLDDEAPYWGHCHAQAVLEHGSLHRRTDWTTRHGQLLAEIRRRRGSS